MSQHHAAIKNDPRWKAARAERLELDDRTCQRCGLTEHDGVQLEVDHIVRLADGGDPFDLGNLCTLCTTCHDQKEREYDAAAAQQRNEWVHSDYPELSELFGIEKASGF